MMDHAVLGDRWSTLCVADRGDGFGRDSSLVATGRRFESCLGTFPPQFKRSL